MSSAALVGSIGNNHDVGNHEKEKIAAGPVRPPSRTVTRTIQKFLQASVPCTGVVMEAKYYSDLVEGRRCSSSIFGAIFGLRCKGTRRDLVHTPNCNAATGCNCSFAGLNCDEITALVRAVQNGMADSSDERVRIRISPQE